MNLLASYQNGGTTVSIHEDGTKIRTIIDPSHPPVHPEQMDLKITNWCDAGCAWCHEKSTKRGQHADLAATLDLLRPLPAGVEIAIGGGDPLSHPEFSPFVRALSAQGLVPSVTVNGRHFERHRDTLDRLTQERAIWGVGISYAGSFASWDYPHQVHHLIVGVDSPRVLEDVHGLKVLLLGYKNFGRGAGLYRKTQAQIEQTQQQWFRELPIIARNHRLSFDNLAIEQLNPARLFQRSSDYLEQHMGEEGQYSMYVDAVTQTFAVSSYAPVRGHWSNIIGMFEDVRRQAFGSSLPSLAA